MLSKLIIMNLFSENSKSVCWRHEWRGLCSADSATVEDWGIR